MPGWQGVLPPSAIPNVLHAPPSWPRLQEEEQARRTQQLQEAVAAAQAAQEAHASELAALRQQNAELRGAAVIVQFGDVGCAVCRENDRLLRHYQLEYATLGLVVVSLHERATLEELRRYDAGFTFSTLAGLDPGQAIARRYRALPVPTTVFIDRGGFIWDVRWGRLEEDDLLRSLQALL